ncbi:MAG: ABC-2 transporter permease [Trebonia sp.]
MNALARVSLLDLRTVAPYRLQLLGTPLLIMAVLYSKPEGIVPALALLSASPMAGYPFMISDRADLDTLYAVLPLTRRSLLLGRYLWALAVFVATAGVGILVSLLLARQENVSLDGYALTAIMALSWALFALNISIQFPLFVRLRYTRAGMLGTTLPIVLVAFVALRTHVDLKPGLVWLILLAVGGVLLFCASAAVAIVLDPRRARGPTAE